jgi:hypothetical protein
MEQFITDWFYEIIFFCLSGLIIIVLVLRSLGKQNEERRNLQQKHYIEETNKKLYDDIVKKTNNVEPVVKKRIYNVQISINNSIVFKNNYKVELPTDAKLLADNDAEHISKENRKYIIRLIK